MVKHECTIEEREEYEPHIQAGNLVYAGVDYARILAEAEKEVDVILWDGGNNDFPFYKPDLWIVVADPHRAGHELSYYPSETNLRMADVIIINKMDSASSADVETVRRNIAAANPKAIVIDADSPLTVADPAAVKGKRVLCVEDGPTVTHGEMGFGAARLAAERLGAAEMVDARPYAVGSIKTTFEKYSHLRNVLPAMGYGPKQISELEQTIDAVPCDLVLIGTPIDLGSILKIKKPAVRVEYELAERTPGRLKEIVKAALAK